MFREIFRLLKNIPNLHLLQNLSFSTAFASPTQFQTTQKSSDAESNSITQIDYTLHQLDAKNVRKLLVNQRKYDYRLQDYRIDNGEVGNSNDNTKIICKDSLNNVTIVSVKQEHNDHYAII